MPTLRHLQIFSEVAKCQKMGEAAQKLYLSQSTVSQAISETEKYYGVLLFERLNKRLVITEAGKVLFDEAGKVLSDFERLEERMHELTNTFALRIGAAGATATHFLYPIGRQMEQEFPGIQLQVHSYSPDYIKRCLLSNIFDVAILPGAADGNDFVSVPAFTDPMCFVCGQDHPFYSRDIVSMRELQGQTFLFRESSDSGRKMLEKLLKENHIDYNTRWSSSNVESLKIFLLDGRGIALLSQNHIEEECKRGELHEFRVEGVRFQRQFCAVYLKDKYISKPLKYFLNACKETAAL